MPPPRVSTGDRGMQCSDRYIGGARRIYRRRRVVRLVQEAALTVPASQTGNRTECALLGLVRGLRRDYDKLRVVVKR